jgi:hypothetical protein
MSSSTLDFNDLDRLSRESQLTAGSPTALPEEPRPVPQEENAGVALIKALANLLTERGVQ